MNPFAFPSETTLRFALLIVFALCGSASLYSTFWAMLNQPIEQAAEDCLAGFFANDTDRTRDLATLGQAGNVQRLAECSAMIRPKVAWQGIGTVVTLAMAGTLYLLLPLLVMKRQKLRPVTDSDPPGLLTEMQALCREIGLQRIPIFVWNPLATTAPHVFGANGRYYCAFSGAFAVRLYDDRSLLRTVVLHELAHIQCGDVGKAYFAIVTCIAFIASAGLPAIPIALVASAHWFDAAELLLRSAMWTAAIGLSGASVLRAREYYADVQTSVWESTTSNLIRVLAGFSGSSEAWWQRLLRLHPSLGARRAAVSDPSTIFHMSAWDAFAVGLAAWLTIDVLKDFAAGFLPSEIESIPIFQILVTVVVPALILVMGVGAVGIGVWRGVFASLVRQERGRGCGRLGLAMGVGCLLPAGLNLVHAMMGQTRLPMATMLNTIVVDLCIGVAVTVCCVLVFSWIAEATSAWFNAAVRYRSPRPVLFSTILVALLLIVGTLAAVSFAAYFYLLTGFRTAAGQPVSITMVAQVVGVPALIACVIVWAFPLCGSLWHRWATYREPADWIFLDDAAPTLPVSLPWAPTDALTIGLVVGFLLCLMIELVFFADLLPGWLADTLRSGFAWLRACMQRTTGNEGDIMLAAGVLCQVTAAVIAAVAARSLPALSGLFAAFVAGTVFGAFNLLFFP